MLFRSNSSINKTIKAVYYTQVGKPEDFARYYDTLPADSTLPTFPGAKVFIDIACDINKPGARYVQEILFSDGNYEVAKKTFTDMRDPSPNPPLNPRDRGWSIGSAGTVESEIISDSEN